MIVIYFDGGVGAQAFRRHNNTELLSSVYPLEYNNF